MPIRGFIRSKKTVIDAGQWSDAKLPRTGGPFPLSKNRSFRLGASWRWRAVKIEIDGKQFRVLITVHEHKQQFVAYCGAVIGTDMFVIGRLEYHATHPGLHVHGCCKPSQPEWFGRTGHGGLARLPEGKAHHRRTTMVVSRESALQAVADVFCIAGLMPPPPAPNEPPDPQSGAQRCLFE